MTTETEYFFEYERPVVAVEVQRNGIEDDHIYRLIGYSVEDANQADFDVFFPGNDERSLAEAKRLAESSADGFNAPRGRIKPI